jgi:DNA mismatch repair protein MutS2
MFFPENIEQKLGFDTVRFHLGELCLSRAGEQWVQQMQFSSTYEQVQLWLKQTEECMAMVKATGHLIETRLPDIERQLTTMKLDGYALSVSDLHQIREHTVQFGKVFRFLQKNGDSYPALAELFQAAVYEGKIVEIINKVVDDFGKMKDNASPELSDLLVKIARAERETEKKINQLYARYKEKEWVADTGVSIKDGRTVLPVLSEHKRKVRGYVHDESGGGKILYIEPEELIELNNIHRELELEKNREIERILRKVTKDLRGYLGILQEHQRLLSLFDFIQAKATYGLKLDASIPDLHRQPGFHFINARHPVLYLNLKKSGKQIVSQNIELGDEMRVMIISGPNGGGKSVTLKTAGLLQYMLQCGIPVPCDKGSESGIFSGIFLDIGDDQSLENHLSSYTSHLMAMKFFMANAREDTLVLIDELGTGTDPAFGGPMGESVLFELNEKRAFGIVTTHFSNLKKAADQWPGLFNASMGYDTENFVPLYTLNIGKPGSSYAFEVASKAGIDPNVIERAKTFTDHRILNLDLLLAELEKEKNEYEELRLDISQKQTLADKLIKEYSTLKASIEENKKQMLDMAREKALTIIENANKQVENTIQEIRKGQANKEKTKFVRKGLEEKKNTLRSEMGLPVFRESDIKTEEAKPLKAGDVVRIKGNEMLAELVEIKGNKATIQTGSIRTVVNLEQLETAKSEKARKEAVQRRGIDLLDKQKDFRSQIDVRGMRGEEALKVVENWLDEAHVLGYSNLRIIHGKGDGILKKLIRDYLRQQSIVQNIYYESIQLGGEGVSLVELK